MAKRRGHGEGTLHRLPSGSWRIRLSLDGQRLTHTAATQRECLEWRDEIRGEIKKGLSFRGTQAGFEAFVDAWLESIATSLRPRTLSHYQQIARDYIKPQFGRFKVRDIRPEQVQALYNHLISDGKSAHLVGKVHTVLQQIFSHALALRLVTIPPTTGVIVPVARQEEMQILDAGQVNRLLITANDSRLGPLLHLAIATGMRQMEILGLRWDDLNWTRHTIQVGRQLVRKQRGDTWQFTQPKTKAGRRIVPLGTRVLEALRQQNARQQLEQRIAGARWQEHELIFTTATGTPIYPRNLLRDYKSILASANLPDTRFHDLRHTAASLMLSNGFPINTVSYILGHSNPAITLQIYAHIIPSTIPAAMEQLDELIAPVPIYLDT